jgi:hypothetical protein
MSKPAKRYYIEHNFSYGWDDAGWTEDEEPLTFATVKQAKQAIREFITEQHQAVADGDMDEKYRLCDYRVKPCPQKP